MEGYWCLVCEEIRYVRLVMRMRVDENVGITLPLG